MRRINREFQNSCRVYVICGDLNAVACKIMAKITLKHGIKHTGICYNLFVYQSLVRYHPNKGGRNNRVEINHSAGIGGSDVSHSTACFCADFSWA